MTYMTIEHLLGPGILLAALQLIVECLSSVFLLVHDFTSCDAAAPAISRCNTCNFYLFILITDLINISYVYKAV